MSEARRVVVTAGGGGIGLIIAKAFVAAGDRVHVCDVNGEAVERVTRDTPAITGTVCDIADRGAVERFVEDAVDELGGIDVLVNNAGIAGPTTSVENLDPDEWDSVLAVNLTGPFNVTRLAIPHLKKSGNGVIIMMSSVGGRFGYANRSTYATTKRALIALAETLALEHGDHVLPAGLRGDGDGDGADERGGGGEDGDTEQPVAGGAGDEGCRDQRGEAPTEGRGQLVAQGGAGVAVAGGEDLGGERGQRAVHGGLHEGHGDQEAEEDAEHRPGRDQQQDRVGGDHRDDTAGDHDGAAADPVGKRGVRGQSEDLHEGTGGEQPQHGGTWQAALDADGERKGRHQSLQGKGAETGTDSQQHGP